MRKIVRNMCAVLVALGCIVYPIYILIIRDGFFHYQYSKDNVTDNSVEILLELLIWVLIAAIGIKWKNVMWIIAVGVSFSYLHMMLFPMLAAALYFVLTVWVGYCISKSVLHYEGRAQFLISYFLGIMILTVSYAVLSALKVGSIRNIQILDALLFVILGIWYFKTQKRLVYAWRECLKVSQAAYVKLIMLMCFVMLAIGRANESLDYDSLWYGLRSAFVLDNKTGIYDNLKLAGCVYTYPKGFETYFLPLSGFDSYGFFYAGNIVFALVILYLAYKICRLFLDREKALWGALLLSAIPGVMNMSITAKTDIITLLAQLLGIYFTLLFLKEKKEIYLGMVFSTYIFAQTLKPTAVILSTTILIALAFVCVVYRIRPSVGKKGLFLTLVSLIDLTLIWYRTYLLTGIPATSVWGNIFRIFGMTDKYPYASGQISQFRTGGFLSEEVIRETLIRMKEFFFSPDSPDTDHVIIAWGTTLCTFLLIVVAAGSILNIKNIVNSIRKSATACFLGLLFVGEFFGCVMSLWLLSKPDGNYFMLYYSVTMIIGMIYMHRELIEREILHRKIITAIFILFIPVNIILTGAVTWAWTNTFSEINWVNKGYYSHTEEFKTDMYMAGCREIYDIMSRNPSNRVLAYGKHPDVERFPCVIESEEDVRAWGNDKLMSTSEAFITYVEFANYDYIFICLDYFQKDSQEYKNVSALFDEKKVSSMLVEGEYILLDVDEIEDITQSLEMKTQFQQLY